MESCFFSGRMRRGEDGTLEQVEGKILEGRKLSPGGRKCCGRKIILSSDFLKYMTVSSIVPTFVQEHSFTIIIRHSVSVTVLHT